MKSTLKFLSASALLTLASSAILTGCPADEDQPCTLDSDCETGYICNTDTESCVLDSEECTGNADCTGEDEACISSPNNDGTSICGVPAGCGDIAVEAERDAYCGGLTTGEECLPAASGEADVVECRAPANCGEAGDPEAFCRNELGVTEEEGVACNTEGETPTCELTVVTENYHVLVDDTTTQDCDLTEDDNGFDSGSDITFVELQDASNASIGYGRTVTYSQGSGMNDFTETDVLDGAAPEFVTDGEQEDIANRCPKGDAAGRFSTTSVLTLGCTGNVVVDFPAEGTNLHAIYNGFNVVTGEYASVCNQSTGGGVNGSDTYEVYVCPAVEVTAKPTDIDCRMNGVKISPNDLGGLKTSPVTGVKDAPASDA